MKKYTPYLLPLIILSVIFFLVFRWYNQRTSQVQEDLFGEGIQIENLSEEELRETLGGSDDLQTVELQPVVTETELGQEGEGAEATEPQLAEGVIRYEEVAGRTRFSVIATLPMSEEPYQVFLRKTGGEDIRHAFTLTSRKGGYLGTASLPNEELPIEVLVTRGGTDVPGRILLRGILEAGTTGALEEPAEGAAE